MHPSRLAGFCRNDSTKTETVRDTGKGLERASCVEQLHWIRVPAGPLEKQAPASLAPHHS